jgi:hypothetical protein
MSSSGEMYHWTGEDDGWLRLRPARDVRNAQSGEPEPVARIRLESGLAVPKLNGLPGTPRRKDREPHGPPSILEKTRNFPAHAWHVRARLNSGGGEGIRSIEYGGGRVDNAI